MTATRRSRRTSNAQRTSAGAERQRADPRPSTARAPGRRRRAPRRAGRQRAYAAIDSVVACCSATAQPLAQERIEQLRVAVLVTVNVALVSDQAR